MTLFVYVVMVLWGVHAQLAEFAITQNIYHPGELTVTVEIADALAATMTRLVVMTQPELVGGVPARYDCTSLNTKATTACRNLNMCYSVEDKAFAPGSAWILEPRAAATAAYIFAVRATTNTLRLHNIDRSGNTVVVVANGAAAAIVLACAEVGNRIVALNATVVTPEATALAIAPETAYDMAMYTSTINVDHHANEMSFTMETIVRALGTPTVSRTAFIPLQPTSFTLLCPGQPTCGVMTASSTSIGHSYELARAAALPCVHTLNGIALAPGACWQQWDVRVPLAGPTPELSIRVRVNTPTGARLTFAAHVRSPSAKMLARSLPSHRETVPTYQLAMTVVGAATKPASYSLPIATAKSDAANGAPGVWDITTLHTDGTQTCFEFAIASSSQAAGVDLVSADMAVCYDAKCGTHRLLPMVVNGIVTQDFRHYAMGNLMQFSQALELNCTRLCYVPDVARHGEITFTWKAVDRAALAVRTDPSITNSRFHYTATKKPPVAVAVAKWYERDDIGRTGSLSVPSVVVCHSDFVYNSILNRCMLSLNQQVNVFIGVVLLGLALSVLIGIAVASPRT
jgi:hypothetical protein